MHFGGQRMHLGYLPHQTRIVHHRIAGADVVVCAFVDDDFAAYRLFAIGNDFGGGGDG